MSSISWSFRSSIRRVSSQDKKCSSLKCLNGRCTNIDRSPTSHQSPIRTPTPSQPSAETPLNFSTTTPDPSPQTSTPLSPATTTNPEAPPTNTEKQTLRFNPERFQHERNAANDDTFKRSPADDLLAKIYGDCIHNNDGRHLHGDIPEEEDIKWMKRYDKTIEQTPEQYNEIPCTKQGQRITDTYAKLVDDVINQKCNSEKMTIFLPLILQIHPSHRKPSDIRKLINKRLAMWDNGHFDALIELYLSATEATKAHKKRKKNIKTKSSRATTNPTMMRDRVNRHHKLISTREINAAGRQFEKAAQNTVPLDPSDLCTKTDKPVIDVLLDKHPDLRDPKVNQKDGPFEPYEKKKDGIPVFITNEDIELTIPKLKGCGGCNGVKAALMKDLCTRYEHSSERLRTSIAELATQLAEKIVPWASIRALMAARLVALDKNPGTRPIAIGDILRRLIAKSIVKVCGVEAQDACNNFNLAAGTPGGIEAAVHALNQVFEGEENIPEEEDIAEDIGAQTMSNVPSQIYLTHGEHLDNLSDQSSPEPNGVLLIDAKNGFNEISRKAMLWTVRHLWPSGAIFTFNCYRHASRLLLRSSNGEARYITSREGVQQGDPIAMLLFALATVPLIKTIREEVQKLRAIPSFADDLSMFGPISAIIEGMKLLLKLGPARGYYPEPSKSIFIPQHPDQLQECKSLLSNFNFNFKPGHRYLGGFIGSKDEREKWLKEKVEEWSYEINHYIESAKIHPQSAYTGFTRSMQAKFTFVQRVVPDTAKFFQPIEKKITQEFLPALLDTTAETSSSIRARTSLPVKLGGIGIFAPTTMSATQYSASRAITRDLTKSLIGPDIKKINILKYRQANREAKSGEKEHRLYLLTEQLNAYLLTKPKNLQRQIKRSQETGQWLSVFPSEYDNTILSPIEFRDNIQMRLNLPISNLPNKCDAKGCKNSEFSVDHALKCRQGGLIHQRHNGVVRTFKSLCSKALPDSNISLEPHIPPDLSIPPDSEAATQLRGDLSVLSFQKEGQLTIFDVRVTNTDNDAQISKPYEDVLKAHEEEKIKKYKPRCDYNRYQFIPLVFSADGAPGPKAEAAMKHLTTKLTNKWKWSTRSTVAFYVRAQISLSLARSMSNCLRYPRKKFVPSPIHQEFDETSARLRLQYQ